MILESLESQIPCFIGEALCLREGKHVPPCHTLSVWQMQDKLLTPKKHLSWNTVTIPNSYDLRFLNLSSHNLWELLSKDIPSRLIPSHKSPQLQTPLLWRAGGVSALWSVSSLWWLKQRKRAIIGILEAEKNHQTLPLVFCEWAKADVGPRYPLNCFNSPQRLFDRAY